MRPAPHDHEQLAQDAISTLKQVINPGQPTVIALQESGVAIVDGIQRNVGRSMARHLGEDYVQYNNAKETIHTNLISC